MTKYIQLINVSCNGDRQWWWPVDTGGGVLVGQATRTFRSRLRTRLALIKHWSCGLRRIIILAYGSQIGQNDYNQYKCD